jgi:methylenetetrahydrofolate dehydrogenase (NADP+) / methenyltetrahydrofolate cyclohydrolase
MTASLLDGKSISKKIQKELTILSQKQKDAGLRSPGLAVILANADQASTIYVANKLKACKRVGIQSYYYQLSPEIDELSLLELIQELNEAQHIDGILVQLPLSAHINTQRIIEAIQPDKDIDGFHPLNLGRLAQGHPFLRPCTPYGIIQLLNAYQLIVTSKHAVVIGASNIVGRPMALELLMAGATVTICHRKTTNLEQHVRSADILVVAAGVQDCVDIAWLQPHQILIDVGIHRLEDGSLRGDVHFERAKHCVAWITPVPGGVGPMTVTTLLQNTFAAFNLHQT